MTEDRRGRLAEEVFSYRGTADGRVLISWNGRIVTTLKGTDARKFLARIPNLDDHEQQLLMARATGNFKRGNEKRPGRD